MVEFDLETKQCVFCAETIRSKAIKCRFCGEFLNSKRAKSAQSRLDDEEDEYREEDGDFDEVLFDARPSILGIWGSLFRVLVVIAFGIFLFFFEIEGLSVFKGDETLASEEFREQNEGSLDFNLTDISGGLELTVKQSETIARYRVCAGLGFSLIAFVVLLVKVIKLKSIYYEVTVDRIEWSRGIFDRQVDNLDMFRVVDLKLRRSLFDCMLGIGKVVLITNDKSDPEFVFEKLHRPRILYDIIKKASLSADQKQGVVHLE